MRCTRTPCSAKSDVSIAASSFKTFLHHRHHRGERHAHPMDDWRRVCVCRKASSSCGRAPKTPMTRMPMYVSVAMRPSANANSPPVHPWDARDAPRDDAVNGGSLE